MKKLTQSLIAGSLAVLLGTAAAAQSRPSSPPAGPVGTAGSSPSAGSAPRTNGAPAAVASDYRLVSGDKLRIEVYKDPQLSQSLQVRPDGKITLPLLGDIPAAGRTSIELRDALAGSLKEYITNPVVTVIVVETMPQVAYVTGEVNNPGPQPIHGQMSVLQVLAAAGGFKDFAKKNDVRIQRKTATGFTILRFKYKDAVEGRGQTIYVQPGDTIIVP